MISPPRTARRAVPAAALTVLLALTACSGGSSHHTTSSINLEPTVSASAVSASAQPATQTRVPRPDPRAGLPESRSIPTSDTTVLREYVPAQLKTPLPPEESLDSPAAIASIPAGAPSAWYANGCRYYHVGRRWVRDYCISPHSARGPVFNGLLAVRNLATKRVVFLDWSRPGYLTVRDPHDPLFNVAYWAALPLDATRPGAGVLYQVFADRSTPLWYRMSDLSQIVATGLGPRIGLRVAPLQSPWLAYLENPRDPHASRTIALALQLNAVTKTPNCLAVRCPQ